MAEDDDVESSNSSAENSSDDEEQSDPELMVTTRDRRKTAGNRYSQIVGQEQEEEDAEDDVALLFAEGDGEEDEEYNSDDGGDDADMSSSDDEDQGPNAAADDLEGEKELEQQAKIERQKKRKADMALTSMAGIKKKVKIDPTALHRAPERPKPSKRRERESWLPQSDALPGRTSSRKQTMAHRQETNARLKENEEQRLKLKAQREQKERQRQADAPKEMTQADRLAEAERVERRNAKSLNRWETKEKERVEEQAAKLAALKNRKLDGPVVTFYSARHTFKGVKPEIESGEEPKKRGPKPKFLPEQPTIPSPSTPGPSLQVQFVHTTPSIQARPPSLPRPIVQNQVPPSSVAPAVAPKVEPSDQPGLLSGIHEFANQAPPQQPPPTAATSTLLGAPTVQTTIQAPAPPASVAEPQPSTPSQNQAEISGLATENAISTRTPPPPLQNTQQVLPAPAIESPPSATPRSQAESSGVAALDVNSEPPPPPQHVPKPLPTLSPEQDGAQTAGVGAPATSQPPSISQPLVSQPAPSPGPSPAPNPTSPPLTQLPVRAVPPSSGEAPPTLPATAQPSIVTPAKPIPPPPKPEPEPEIETISTRNLVILDKMEELSAQARDAFNVFQAAKKSTKASKQTHEMCVLTGLTARYRDPNTGVKYANAAAFKKLKQLRQHKYRWSSMLGCYTGRVGHAANGVPQGFLGPET